MSTHRQATASFISGLLFGAGLALSQMINPLKVMNFLDFFGNWDPSLGLVMLAGVAVTTVGFKLVLNIQRPLFDLHFHLPKASEVDGKLLLGAMIFGIGWGLAGYCPGPGLAAMAMMIWEPVLFTAAVIAGFYLHRAVSAP